MMEDPDLHVPETLPVDLDPDRFPELHHPDTLTGWSDIGESCAGWWLDNLLRWRLFGLRRRRLWRGLRSRRTWPRFRRLNRGRCAVRALVDTLFPPVVLR